MTVTVLRLSELIFEFPEIANQENAVFYSALSEKLMNYVRDVGTNSNAYRMRRNKLLHAGLNGGDIMSVIDGIGYIRPLFDLWSRWDKFLSKVPTNEKILGLLSDILNRTARKRLGRLTLREAFQLFYTKYDMLGNGLPPFCNFLQQQLSNYEKKELMFGLELIHDDVTSIVSANGHLWLAQKASKDGRTLFDVAEKWGIPTLNSRFFQASEQLFYLNRIEALEPNEVHSVLYEVRDAKVHRSSYKNGQMLGHPIVISLIDKLSFDDGEPTDLWVKTILAIAGDPRVPSSHQNYREWWSCFGTERIRQMRRWLSKVDMELFLDIMKEFSERKGGEDMRRMFPKRKRFLQGLFHRNLVQDAQLFLSSQPERYLKERSANQDQFPQFIQLVGTNNKLAIFYFRLENIHIVEGTHTFALSIMDELPDNCPIGKYEKKFIDQRSLGIGLQEDYIFQFGSMANFERIVHSNRWLEKAYNHLKHLGVSIEPYDIMDAEDYRRMIGVWH